MIRLEHVTKTYDSHPPIEALTGVDLEVARGERVAVVGHSGSGKSTLLNVLGLLDEPTAGRYALNGEDTGVMTFARRDRTRAETLGFVFQDAHVLGHRTVAENIDLRLAIIRSPRANRRQLIADILDRVGLAHRRDALGRLLSGGEKQRLAIARALVTRPTILLADEPTGNLDEVNSSAVLDLFDAAACEGTTVIVITHDRSIAGWADRALTLTAGSLIEAVLS